MRKAEFAVPSEVMAEFANEMAERELDNKVVGTTEDDEILVEVSYEKEETEIVDELETILDDLIGQVEEPEDDQN
jgi:capsular polysaccharide biosynthesis protein